MADETVTSQADLASAAECPPFLLRFSARDLLNVAVFAVIYSGIGFLIAMLGIASPLVMLLTLPLVPIAVGIPYMLFFARVRQPGTVVLFGLTVGLLFSMMGHPWQSTLTTIAGSVLAELTLWAGRYRSKWSAIWAYTVFSVWFIGPWIPLFIDREAYLRAQSTDTMGADHLAAFAEAVTAPAVLIMVGACLVCGFLGALLGTVVLGKRVRKAGLV